MIEVLTVGPLATNGIVLHQGADAIIADPGDKAERFIEFCNSKSLTVHAVLLTHGHGDHIGGVPGIKKEYPDVPVICHEIENEMLQDPAKNLSAWTGGDVVQFSADQLVKHGDLLRFGKIELEVRHVPGHTEGHVIFVEHKTHEIIVGDTLFAGGVGRWDLPGGNGKLLFERIKSEILTLDDDYIAYPGHGSVTSIGEEKRSNPYFQPEKPIKF